MPAIKNPAVWRDFLFHLRRMPCVFAQDIRQARSSVVFGGAEDGKAPETH